MPGGGWGKRECAAHAIQKEPGGGGVYESTYGDPQVSVVAWHGSRAIAHTAAPPARHAAHGMPTINHGHPCRHGAVDATQSAHLMATACSMLNLPRKLEVDSSSLEMEH
jgi:hypothetical protein